MRPFVQVWILLPAIKFKGENILLLKTARRFLNRNGHKLAVHRINEIGKAKLKRAKIARKVLKKDLMGKLWKRILWRKDIKMKALRFLKSAEENVMQEEERERTIEDKLW